jgi:hypothetical protein
MSKLLDPFRFVLVAVAGWMDQRQLQAIDYLREENRVLREQLGDRRLLLTDDPRCRLAAKAKGLGRKLLAELATIVTPKTLLAWHRRLIAQKYDGSGKRGPGRAAHRPRTRSSGGCAWPRRTATGVIGESRVHCRIWGTSFPAAQSLTFCSVTALSQRLSGAGRQHGKSSDTTVGTHRGR